jgi:hypothetical protein
MLVMPPGALQSEAALTPPAQQQQHVGWLDALHVPQQLRKRAPSRDQLQQPAATDPASSFDAAAPAAADIGSSSSSRSSASDSNGRWKARRVRLLQLLDSPGTSWLLMVMTLFVIFQEDVKYAVLPPSADLGLEAITLALLLLFMLEIGAAARSSSSGAAKCSSSCHSNWRPVWLLSVQPSQPPYMLQQL